MKDRTITGEECCPGCLHFAIGTVVIYRPDGIFVFDGISTCKCLAVQALFISSYPRMFTKEFTDPLKRGIPLPLEARILSPICKFRFWKDRVGKEIEVKI